jgi:hypothetical protein
VTSVLERHYVEARSFAWFLRSHTWQHHVLRVAINDLRSLFSERCPAAGAAGRRLRPGKSFKHLQQVFAPAPDRRRRRPHSLNRAVKKHAPGLPWS